MTSTAPDALVLGAGIQGVCAALALPHAGRRVTVVDAADDCMQRTSVHNEGKIHLGFAYSTIRAVQRALWRSPARLRARTPRAVRRAVGRRVEQTVERGSAPAPVPDVSPTA